MPLPLASLEHPSPYNIWCQGVCGVCEGPKLANGNFYDQDVDFKLFDGSITDDVIPDEELATVHYMPTWERKRRGISGATESIDRAVLGLCNFCIDEVCTGQGHYDFGQA